MATKVIDVLIALALAVIAALVLKDDLLLRPNVPATYLRPIVPGMSRKPQRPQRTTWHVYVRTCAARREWVGEIEAANKREAVEMAAKEFKQPVKKLIAVAAAMTGRDEQRLAGAKHR
jgi:hypothetical protein